MAVVSFDGEDAEMRAAIRVAQESFPTFLAEIELECRRIVPAFDVALVKYAFEANKNGVAVEHMFVSDLWVVDGKMRGVLASEPRDTGKIKAGDEVEIQPARVSDWIYVCDGVGVGGATFKVMWRRFTDGERAAYRNEAPFVWLKADLA